jgi:hypothetical protein
MARINFFLSDHKTLIGCFQIKDMFKLLKIPKDIIDVVHRSNVGDNGVAGEEKAFLKKAGRCIKT